MQHSPDDLNQNTRSIHPRTLTLAPTARKGGAERRQLRVGSSVPTIVPDRAIESRLIKIDKVRGTDSAEADAEAAEADAEAAEAPCRGAWSSATTSVPSVLLYASASLHPAVGLSTAFDSSSAAEINSWGMQHVTNGRKAIGMAAQTMKGIRKAQWASDGSS